jgi:hypothetical protein
MGIPIPIIGGLIDRVFSIVDKAVPNKDEAAKIKAELATLDWQKEMAQIGVNLKEAEHKSIFVAGWRPFIGWVCGVCLLYQIAGYSMITWLLSIISPETPAPPQSDNEILLYVLGGMLGFGGMRTLEKIRGVASNSLKTKGD